MVSRRPTLENRLIDFYFDAPFRSSATEHHLLSTSPNNMSEISTRELRPERPGSWFNENRPTKRATRAPIFRRWVRERVQVQGGLGGVPN